MHGFGFLAKLIVAAIVPIALVLAIVAVNVHLLTRPCDSSTDEASVYVKRHATPSGTAKSSLPRYRAQRPCLFVLFYALPLVSSIAFRAFSCECFDYSRLCLRADYELICGEKVRKKARSTFKRSYFADYNVYDACHPCNVDA